MNSMAAYMRQVEIWAEAYDQEAVVMSPEEFEALYNDAFFEAMDLEKGFVRPKEETMNEQKVEDRWPDIYREGGDAFRIGAGSVVDVSVKQPDELSFVDEDIRELFKGCCYTMGMPLMAQLIKELRLQRRAKDNVGG